MGSNTEKEKTNKELRAAFNRLVDGNPKSREMKKRLREKGKIKISPYTVELERGKSIGVIAKGHSDIETMIREHNNPELKLNSNEPSNNFGTDASVAEMAKLQLEIVDLKKKLTEKNQEIKKEQALKDGYRVKNEKLEAANKILMEEQHELIQALFSEVPLEERYTIFKKHNSDLKVVSIASRRDAKFDTCK